MPSVSTLSMDPRVTRLAQRDQIAPVMRATFTQRQFMMHLFSLHDDPTLEAQLTERMLLHVLITDPFPRSSITLLCPGITPILFILTVHLCLVFRTISSFRQIRTARISARLLRFPRHLSTFFLSGIRKALQDLLPQGFCRFFTISVYHVHYDKSSQKVDTVSIHGLSPRISTISVYHVHYGKSSQKVDT